MTCPTCFAKTKTIETKSDTDSIVRRRECLRCKCRFSTIEIDKDLYLRMVNRNDNGRKKAGT